MCKKILQSLFARLRYNKPKGSSAVGGNMFLESNASWIPGTYVGSSIPGTYLGSSTLVT